jgi:hypothetical protein
MKFGQDCQVELEKSFELYHQFSVIAVTIVAKNFIHFAFMDKREQNAANS